MQSVDQIEKWWETPDPWGYETNPDDQERKRRILEACKGNWKRALDIGCGEGFITRDLPAKEIEGYEVSNNAAKRLPGTVKRVTAPSGKYDLILAAGILYEHYEYEKFLELIKNHASGRVILCNIKDWEVDVSSLGKPIHEEEFPYREFTQKLRTYDFSHSQH